METNYLSKLQMLDIYFSNIVFKQNKKELGKVNLKINYDIDYLVNNDDKSVNQVSITTTINDESNQIYLEIIAKGIFKIKDDIDEQIKGNLIKTNTVAIMFPYIRSQIAIITAQPGLTPIQLPIIDVNKLVNE